jgi:uncharacterized membrane protein
MRWSTALLVFSVALIWGLAWYWWPQVPQRVPLHFDLAGRPDRYGERGFGSWFLLPLLATLLALFLGVALPKWLRWLAVRAPGLLNLPRHDEFLRLSVPGRLRAIEPVHALLQLLASEVVLMFAWISYATLQVATGAWERLPSAFVIVVIATVLATALGSLPLLRRAVERADSPTA